MAVSLLEAREHLAPFVGHRVRCRAVLMRDGTYKDRPETFVVRLDVRLDGAWVRVAGHGWVHGAALCRHFGRGVLTEFEALVRAYRSDDPSTGRVLDRFGLTDPWRVTPIGPADLLELARELVQTWGFDRVAVAVVAAGEQG